MTSVVIPAHNEEGVIGRLLRGLTTAEAGDPGDLDIVVVCNGCSDRTAEVAREFGDAVRVIETEVASKSHALRLGDEAARSFPRFYVDADVALSRRSLGRVADALETGPHLAAAPRMRVDLARAPWPVRAYYQIWLRLPYHREGMIGSGVYAMSREGRDRFDVFPDIISDDGFARLHFGPSERVTVESAEFTITPPTSLAGVVHVKRRSQKGLLQLHRLYPELLRNDPRDYSLPLVEILRNPLRWPASLVYLYVILRTKLAALWMNYRGDLATWERDDTSRSAGGES
ncbi:MAG: glycosyltransferase [Deltaproteobacteria bacterium]|nr:glycosyltransferase [Deltaproteobacteria bacterium]